MSDHILHVVIELESWGSDPADPTAALQAIKQDIAEHLNQSYSYDAIEGTGLHLGGVTVI